MGDALKIFETINQRGKTLNPMDLLKNMLFMHEQTSFSKLNNQWKEMITKLEDIEEKPLRFLRYYITSTYDISDVVPDHQGIIKEEKIYSWLSNNNDKCHYKEDPMKFTKEMIRGLEDYCELLNPDNNTPGADYLNNIRSLMGKSSRLHLVSLLAARHLSKPLKEELYKTFETIIYYSVVNDIKSNVLERLFSSWCPDLRNVKNKAGLDKFISKRVAPTLENWNRTYENNFMNLSLETLQKYKIKAILARISKYVDAYKAGGGELANIQPYLNNVNEVEHIMPQTCDDISRYGADDKEQYDRYKQKLGNLTLLEKTLNHVIQNDTFAEKCKGYEGSAFYLTRSISELQSVGNNNALKRINKKLMSWDDWTLDAIDERQNILYELSLEIWRIPE